MQKYIQRFNMPINFIYIGLLKCEKQVSTEIIKNKNKIAKILIEQLFMMLESFVNVGW